MTMPIPAPAAQEAVQVPPYDQGNALLAGVPAQLTTSIVPTAEGNRQAVTIRTASTTLTVLLDRDDSRTWGRTILNGADQIGGLIAAPGPLAGLLP